MVDWSRSAFAVAQHQPFTARIGAALQQVLAVLFDAKNGGHAAGLSVYRHRVAQRPQAEHQRVLAAALAESIFGCSPPMPVVALLLEPKLGSAVAC